MTDKIANMRACLLAGWDILNQKAGGKRYTDELEKSELLDSVEIYDPNDNTWHSDKSN